MYIYFKIHILVKAEKSFKGFSIFSSGGVFVKEWNGLSIFGRGLPKKHSCKIILKSVHRFSRRSCLKLFSIYSPGGNFVQRTRTVSAILVWVTPETSLYNYFKIDPLVKEEKSLKVFLFLALAAILLNGSERFEQFR